MNSYNNNIMEIIRSASELFAAYDYDGTSISEICKEGKISKGKFYYYFNDKEDLFTACCKSAYSVIDNVFDMFQFDNNLNLMDNLLNIFRCYQKIFENHQYIPYIIYTVNSSPPPALRDKREEIVEKHQVKFLQLIKEILKKCSIDVSPSQVAIGFNTAFIMAYAKDGVFSCEAIHAFVGKDVFESFAYYLDKILFGVLPRDAATTENPKATRNIIA